MTLFHVASPHQLIRWLFLSILKSYEKNNILTYLFSVLYFLSYKYHSSACMEKTETLHFIQKEEIIIPGSLPALKSAQIKLQDGSYHATHPNTFIHHSYSRWTGNTGLGCSSGADHLLRRRPGSIAKHRKYFSSLPFPIYSFSSLFQNKSLDPAATSINVYYISKELYD